MPRNLKLPRAQKHQRILQQQQMQEKVADDVIPVYKSEIIEPKSEVQTKEPVHEAVAKPVQSQSAITDVHVSNLEIHKLSEIYTDNSKLDKHIVEAIQTKLNSVDEWINNLKINVNPEGKSPEQILESIKEYLKNHDPDAKVSQLQHDLKTAGAGSEVMRADLEKKERELEEKGKELEGKRGELESKEKELKTKGEELASKIEQIGKLESQIKEVTLEKTKIKEQNEGNEKKLANIQHELTEEQGKLKQKSDDLEKARSENEEAKKQYDKLDKEKQALEKEQKEKQDEYTKAGEAQSQAKQKEHEEEVKNLKDQIEKLKKEAADEKHNAEASKKELEAIKLELKGANDKLTEKSSDSTSLADQLNKKNNELTKAVDELTKEKDALLNDKTDLTSKLKEAETNLSLISAEQAKTTSHDAKLKDLESQIKTAKDELSRAQGSLETQKKSAQDELRKATESNSQLQKDKDGLNSRIAELENQLKQVTAQQPPAVVQGLTSAEKQALEAEIEKFKKEASDKKQQADSSKKELEALTTSSKSQEEKRRKETEAKDGEIRDLKNRLQEVSKEVQAAESRSAQDDLERAAGECGEVMANSSELLECLSIVLSKLPLEDDWRNKMRGYMKECLNLTEEYQQLSMQRTTTPAQFAQLTQKELKVQREMIQYCKNQRIPNMLQCCKQSHSSKAHTAGERTVQYSPERAPEKAQVTSSGGKDKQDVANKTAPAVNPPLFLAVTTPPPQVQWPSSTPAAPGQADPSQNPKAATKLDAAGDFASSSKFGEAFGKPTGLFDSSAKPSEGHFSSSTFGLKTSGPSSSSTGLFSNLSTGKDKPSSDPFGSLLK